MWLNRSPFTQAHDDAVETVLAISGPNLLNHYSKPGLIFELEKIKENQEKAFMRNWQSQ